MPPAPRSRRQIANRLLQGAPSGDTGYDIETGQLAFNIRRNLARAGEDEGILDRGMNILGRGFDVLSRPLYGVAETFQTLVEQAKEDEGTAETLGGILPSLWRGVSGQEKTTFSDVLETAGVENGLVKGVGGFALDIVGDPLTYTGVGLARKITQETVESVAGQAASKVIKEAGERHTEAHAAKVLAARAARVEGGRQGLGRDVIKKMGEEAGDNEVIRLSDIAREAAKAEQLATGETGRVLFKVLGKEVGSSKQLYKAGSKLTTAIGKTKTGRAINKAFRPVSTFLGSTHNLKRVTESVGMANAEKLATVFMEGGNLDGILFPAFKDLSRDEAVQVSHALESLTDLADPRLQQYVDAAKQMNDRFFDIEFGTYINDPENAIRNASDYIDNYVHHTFDRSLDNAVSIDDFGKIRKREAKFMHARAVLEATNYAKKAVLEFRKTSPIPHAAAWDARKAAKKAGVKDKKELEKIAQTAEKEAEAKYYHETAQQYLNENRERFKTSLTLKDAVDKGLHPELDIRNIMGAKIYDHTRRVGRVKFMNGVTQEFGVNLPGKIGEKQAARMGMVRSRSKFIPPETYFPKEIADVIKKIDDVFYLDEAAGAGLRDLYDNALGKVKFLQTVVNPGHHLRNMLSDVTLNFMDGVVDPRVYGFSGRILMGIRKDSQGIQLVDNAFQDVTEHLDQISIPVGDGLELTGDRIWNLFVSSGGKSGFYRSEIVQKPGRFTDKIRRASEYREDWTRLAHFIDALGKEAKGLGPKATSTQLNEAAMRAGARVRKWNIDYGDLTPFEQRTMKRVLPFYTWMRKNIPLQIESLFMRPGRAAIAPKFMEMLRESTGAQEDIDILGLNALPDYMRDAMSVALIGEGQGNNGVYWNPASAFPVMDLNEFLGRGSPGEFAERQLAGLTPFARLPIEQVTGHNFFTGRPENKSFTEALISSVPVGRLGQRFLQEGQSPLSVSGLNWLTGTGISTVNQGMQQGELRRQEDIVQALLRRRREELGG